MCGVWVALEDIGPDQGPLVYYPGSHRLPEMNYPDFGLRAHPSSYPQYLEELQKLIASHGYEPEYGLLKKGQALIWSANILHGGSTQRDRSLSRHSQVTHYYATGARYWRPVESLRKRRYFEPDWVKDVSGEPHKYPLKDPLPPFMFRIKTALKRTYLKYRNR